MVAKSFTSVFSSISIDTTLLSGQCSNVMAGFQELFRIGSEAMKSRLQSPFASNLSVLSRSHVRCASILSSLSDNPAAYNRRIRKGRGASSGKGKTSGRGHKGQRQHGKVPAGFEGGQTPLHVVKGKRGFENLYVRAARSR